MELREYARVLRRRWLTIVLAVEAALLAGFIATALTEPLYSSTARLFVANPSGLGDTDDTAYQGSQFSHERVASYAQIIAGPRLAQAVVDQLGLAMTPGQLQSRVTARAVPDTVLVAVSVADAHPETAQRLTQALAEQFVRTLPDLESAPADRLRANVLIAEPAGAAAKVSPQPARNLGLSLVLGLLLAAGLALLRELLDDRVNDPEQLVPLTGAEPLQVVGPGGTPTRTRGAGVEEGRQGELRWLAAQFQVGLQEGRLRSVLLAGLAEADRDSTLAVDLALTLAGSGVDVVLVDVDLAHGLVGVHLGLDGAPGLAHVLTPEPPPTSGLDELLWQCAPGLRVLPAGHHAVVLRLSVHRLPEVLRELERRCELLVVSAPPLLTAAESGLAAAHASAVVLEVVRGRTTRRQVQRGLDALQRVSASLAGTVLVDAPLRSRLQARRSSPARPPGRAPGQRTPGERLAGAPHPIRDSS